MRLRYPPSISDRHRRALDQVAADLEAEFGPRLLSLVVGGSVAAGSARDHSDVDLSVIVDVPWFQRRRMVVDSGIEIDLFIDFPARVHAEINRGNHIFIKTHAVGWIVFDTNDIAVRARQAAKPLLDKPMREIEEGPAFTLRNRAKDILSDFRRVAGVNDVEARYLLAVLVPWCVAAAFRIRRVWPGAEKRALEELRAFAPDVHALAVRLLTDELTADMIPIANEFVAAVFGSDLDKAIDAGPRVEVPRPDSRMQPPSSAKTSPAVAFENGRLVIRR